MTSPDSLINTFFLRRTIINDDASTRFHRIRLHGPWQAEVLSRFDSETDAITENDSATENKHATTKFRVPGDWADWLGHSFCGQVLFRRPFGKPTALDPGQAVWIVVESVIATGEVSLNDNALGAVNTKTPLRVRIDHLLENSNRLTIVVELSREDFSKLQTSGGLTGSVFLEIDES